MKLPKVDYTIYERPGANRPVTVGITVKNFAWANATADELNELIKQLEVVRFELVTLSYEAQEAANASTAP